MTLDSATLDDLEILSTPVRQGVTVLSLVDRTRTRAGREALRRRLVTPVRPAEEIRALQLAHQFLASDAPGYRVLFDRVDLDSLERYLSSNWQRPSARPALSRLVNTVWRPAWFRQYLEEVEEGQGRVRALLEVATELRTLIAADDTEVLRETGATIELLLSSSELDDLRRVLTRTSASSRLAFDELARGSAKPRLMEIVSCIAAIEAMWSVGVATKEHLWSYPTPGTRLRATGLYHPFLGSGAVSNDIDLDAAVRVCFVTGPNMAGKSTFLKAVAIAVLLAHVGCGVPAASMEFPFVGTIVSNLQIADNLAAGESFYLVEVRRIRALAEALNTHGSAIAVLDEPFRGTNVHDAAEATLAIISRLLDHRGALVFVASHLAEIVPAFLNDPRVRLLQFSADLADDAPSFDYCLREGISTQRLGMVLLKQEHVLDLLEQSAVRSLSDITG